MRLSFPKRASIAAVAAASLAMGLLVPASPAVAQETYPDSGPSVMPAAPNNVPAYEPQLGRGQQLLAGEPQNIALGSSAASAHSALVRLSVFDVAQALEVTLAGATALTAATGRSASTTVLVPVTAGEVSMQASANANARLDVLALFSGDPAAAGSTVALREPVLRADTLGALASGGVGEGIGTAETSVGLIGLGGVPVDGVRSAHVTATVTANAPSTLVLDGQRLPLAAGTTSISTVVTPSADGDVQVHAEGSAVQLRLHVRGYVAEAAENAAAVNGPGSFWPTTNATSRQYTVNESAPQAVELEGVGGTQYVLALVDAAATGNLTMVELGKTYRGRARGAVVDPQAGAQPQLALVPTTDPALTLRRGSTGVSVLELGSFLGTDTGTTAGAGSLSLTSPTTNKVDASDTLALTFEGTATPDGTAPLRIEVKLDGKPHGSAAVRPGNNGLGWTFTTALKDAATHTFDFVLVHRSGATSTTSWSGGVTLPGADATVLTPDTVVIGSPGHVAEVQSVVDDAVYFASDPNVVPGEIIASGSTAGAPNGFLRRVVAVDIVDGQWKLTTVLATLDEVILQADYEHTEQLGTKHLAGISEEPADPANAQSITNEFFNVLTGDQVDLAPYPGEVLNPEGEVLENASLATGFSGSAGGASRSVPGVLPMETELEEKLSFKMGATLNGEEEEEGPDDPNGDNKDNVKVSLSAEAEMGFALKVKLKSTLKWTEASWLPPKPPLPYPSVDEFATSQESTAKATSKMTVAAERSWSKEWDGPSKTVNFNPLTFSVGILPVVVTSALKVDLKGELGITGTATLAASASVERKHVLGFQYKDGKVGPIDEGPKTTYKPFALDDGTGLKGAVEATVGPEIAFTAKLYDLAGPEMGFSIKVGTSVTAEASLEKGTVEFELFLEGKLFIKAELTVPVIKKKLLSVTLLETTKKWGLKKTLFDYKDLFPEDPAEDPNPETPPDDDVDYGQDELSPANKEVAALDVNGADVLSSFFVEGPPDPSAAGVFSQAVGGLPTTGNDYFVMSTGRAGHLFDDFMDNGVFGVGSKRGPGINDATTLRIDLDVPAKVNCLIGFDFRFYSDEYPNFVGSRYNDAFIVELDKSTWTVEGQEITAPRNFAFDELGNPITINSAGPWTINKQNALGTAFNGATSLLRATTPVTPGKHSLFLSIFDMGDSALDSAVLIDSIEFGTVGNPATQCQQGVSVG